VSENTRPALSGRVWGSGWVVDGGRWAKTHAPRSPEERGVDGGRWAMTNAPGSLEEPGGEVEGGTGGRRRTPVLC
jgi:hypothetical protein